MNQADMKDRTKQFSLRVIRLVNALPKTVEGKAISGQLVRSGMSVGANYRAVCRSRSKMEFLSKLGTVEEEANESAYWMELIIETGRTRTKWNLFYERLTKLRRLLPLQRKRSNRLLIENPTSKIGDIKNGIKALV
jgi:four helix bundle protein